MTFILVFHISTVVSIDSGFIYIHVPTLSIDRPMSGQDAAGQNATVAFNTSCDSKDVAPLVHVCVLL